MPHRRRNRPTILRGMVLIAVAGGILGGLAANRADLDVVGFFVIASLMVAVPAHLAIEANRRDAIEAGRRRAGHPDRDAPPGPP